MSHGEGQTLNQVGNSAGNANFPLNLLDGGAITMAGLTAVRVDGVGAPTVREHYLPFGQPDFGEGEIAAVTRVLNTGWVGMGPETIAFERELAEYCEADHVVAVNSCTSALFLSLAALGIGPGDEVIVPSLTWISTANAARHLGAKPVFCDIDLDTLSMKPALVRACLTPRTKAVIVVHMGGLAVDVAAIRKVLPKHIAIVEDAAHAFGARYDDGTPVGSAGNLTCFSFYANKNLSTGDGGAVAVADPTLASQIASLRQHGLPNDAWKRFTDPRTLAPGAISDLGYKMNYTDLQASIGRVQLRRQGEFAERRLAIAKIYSEALAALPWHIPVQTGATAFGHSRHLFLIQLPLEHFAVSRNDVLRALRDRNIGASVHYHPIHTMPLYAPATTLPITELVGKRTLTLPISPSMTVDDAAMVVEALEAILENAAQLPRSVA